MFPHFALYSIAVNKVNIVTQSYCLNLFRKVFADKFVLYTFESCESRFGVESFELFILKRFQLCQRTKNNRLSHRCR